MLLSCLIQISSFQLLVWINRSFSPARSVGAIDMAESDQTVVNNINI